MRLADLSAEEGWTLLRDAELRTLGFIETPVDGRLVFAIDDANVRRALATEGVAAILTTPQVADALRADGPDAIGWAVTDAPGIAFAKAHNRLAADGFYGIPATRSVSADAKVHPTAHIDPAGVIVAAGCRIGPRAVILAGTILEEGVEVMAGAILGGRGFQVIRGREVVDFAHVGALVVGARSVVMANAVLARAVFLTETRIGSDCRIGNNAFVSHNCQIGDRCLIGHGAVIAGGCRIGRNVTLGPGVVCIDRREIGEGATVTAGATVARDVPANVRVSGPFARTHLGSARDDD